MTKIVLKSTFKAFKPYQLSSMLKFTQTRSRIILKSVSASLGLNITYFVIKEGKISMKKSFAVLFVENHLLRTNS